MQARCWYWLGGLSPGRPGVEKKQLIQVDVFMKLCWALLFLGVSGMTSARNGVTHLVLSAWSSVLHWPLDFSCTQLYFYSPITVFLVQNKMFQVCAEDVQSSPCLLEPLRQD